MKLVIVEDSLLLRGKIVEMLSSIIGLQIVGMSGEPKDAIDKINRSNPDMVILDIKLQNGSGIDVLQYIKEEYPRMIVIMFTNYLYPQMVNRCMELGADYFFDKSRDFYQLKDIVVGHVVSST